MDTTIKLLTNANGQVVTEQCYDAELTRIYWEARDNIIGATFKCPKGVLLRITFRDVITFRIDGLEKYNISSTFFMASDNGFDEKEALQYLKELFQGVDVVEESARYQMQQQMHNTLLDCHNGDSVLFANDAAVGCVITILSKSVVTEFAPGD